jgi:hypothetical protein
MTEKPLERLNYFNGQRLEAADLKTEQEYHIRTRRWLNKSLYSPGIADGLEVQSIPGSLTVLISPGLALNNEGYEIIVLQEILVEVQNYMTTNAGGSTSSYLIIEYAETNVDYDHGECNAQLSRAHGAKLSSPSRIQTGVKFSWMPYVPLPTSGKIVLARVELNNTCTEILQIDPSARRSVNAVTRQYALEGEREIAFIPKELFPEPETGSPPRQDVEEIGRVYFHIQGKQAYSVTLHLRAERISLLHYTELPYHSHPGDVTGSTTSPTPDLPASLIRHHHPVTSKTTSNDQHEGISGHVHKLHAWRNITDAFNNGNNEANNLTFRMSYADNSWKLEGERARRPILEEADGIIDEGIHDHTIAAFNTEDWDGLSLNHIHDFNNINLNILDQGVIDSINVGRNTGEILTFVDDLQILIEPNTGLINRTTEIQRRLADIYTNWSNSGTPKKLGDGTSSHELAINGTGAIHLHLLENMHFVEGEYCIIFKVGVKLDSNGNRIANGGKIHYNLYVEE